MMYKDPTYKNIKIGLRNTMQRYGKAYARRQSRILLASLSKYTDEESVKWTAIFKQVCIDLHLIDGDK